MTTERKKEYEACHESWLELGKSLQQQIGHRPISQVEAFMDVLLDEARRRSLPCKRIFQAPSEQPDLTWNCSTFLVHIFLLRWEEEWVGLVLLEHFQPH